MPLSLDMTNIGYKALALKQEVAKGRNHLQ